MATLFDERGNSKSGLQNPIVAPSLAYPPYIQAPVSHVTKALVVYGISHLNDKFCRPKWGVVFGSIPQNVSYSFKG
jgi:hypothetical protein